MDNRILLPGALDLHERTAEREGQEIALSGREFALLEYFLRHRREVVTRRTIYDLRKARERAHLLEGLAIALSNIDPIIALIKAAASPAEAFERNVGMGSPLKIARGLNAQWTNGGILDSPAMR